MTELQELVKIRKLLQILAKDILRRSCRDEKEAEVKS